MVNVNDRVYGTCACSRARPKSSGEVVMKKSENTDMSVTNRSVIAAENTNVDPKTKFMTNISTARRRPALIDPAHYLQDFAAYTIGS